MTFQYEHLQNKNITNDDKNCFVKLVVAGGAVKEGRVREGIEREGAQLFITRCAGEIVGVAALKVPIETYWTTLTEKSGYTVTQANFPRELGYVAVSPAHSGKGIAKVLCDLAMRYAGNQGVFATTGTAQMLTSILPKLGFRWEGKVWKGHSNQVTGKLPDLHLMVRPMIS